MANDLQLTLVIALLVMALINVSLLAWAWHLSNRLKSQPTPKVYNVHMDGTKLLTEAELAEVQRQASAVLKQTATESANQLKESMKHTVEQAAMHMDETVQNTVKQEFEEYHVSLEALREQSITEFSKQQKELDEKRVRMQEALERVAKTELARRVDQFNLRLSNVVSGYIVESLGSRVDLGAQLPYILQNLESHKDDIKRDVLNQ